MSVVVKHSLTEAIIAAGKVFGEKENQLWIDQMLNDTPEGSVLYESAPAGECLAEVGRQLEEKANPLESK